MTYRRMRIAAALVTALASLGTVAPSAQAEDPHADHSPCVANREWHSHTVVGMDRVDVEKRWEVTGKGIHATNPLGVRVIAYPWCGHQFHNHSPLPYEYIGVVYSGRGRLRIVTRTHATSYADPAPTQTSTATPTSQPPGFPDASNTGVPAGTTLSAYTGPCTITAAGTVIDSKTVNCPLAIQAANVTIRNSKVNGNIAIDTDVNQSWSLTLTDSEVDAGDAEAIAAIGNGNADILRVNIHGGHNALQCEEHSSHCNITDSWIHGQYLGADSVDHLAGIGVFGALSPCQGPDANGVPACFAAVHNSILCEPLPNASNGGCTADLAILNQFGPLPGALVQDNLFGANVGAAYCTYGGTNPNHASDHIVYTGNVFQRGANGRCAAFGPVTSFDSGGVGNVWTNNTWDDGGAVPPAN
jgi:hypothetical protein